MLFRSYAVGGKDDIDDQSTVSTDGHRGHTISDNLGREFKNITVSELNNNSVAMEIDGQEAATMTRDNQPRTSNPLPPVEQLDDPLDYDEGSEVEERKEKKQKKKARRGTGKAKKEKEKKEQEERKKEEQKQSASVTISSEEYQQLKQQNELVLKMAERLAGVERVLKRCPTEGESLLPDLLPASRPRRH